MTENRSPYITRAPAMQARWNPKVWPFESCVYTVLFVDGIQKCNGHSNDVKQQSYVARLIKVLLWYYFDG